MNRCPRPSSPPAPASSSAPASPTVTQLSSRSPTPSPSDSHDSSRRTPLRSPSPPRSASPSVSNPVNMDCSLGERVDDVDRGVGPKRPSLPASSASAPVIRLPDPLLTLPLSEYQDESIPRVAQTPRTSLAELAHLIRLQPYQEQLRSENRVRLHRWLVSAALSTRLLHCGELAYRTLIDYFRSDDRKNFATLYNALHDVRSSCDATRRYALLEPDLDSKTKVTKSDTTSFSTFMHEIPQKIRSELLAFICEIRTNPDFLAARIASLSQSELLALASFRPALEPDSIMASSKGGIIAKKPSMSSIPNPVERLLSFQRHDPLSALIYTCFANSSGPDSNEDLRRTDAWATTCARLITDAKQGSERLIKSVLDAWAGMRDWPAKHNIELFLMQVLQDGQFLIEKGDQAKTIMTQKEFQYAFEEFLDRSVKRLFDVIDDEPSAGGMPDGVWEIGIAIMKKLGKNKHFRSAAENVIIYRWFFSGYLPNALVFPESHGIMVGYHISPQARDRILKPIASAAHKQATSVFLTFSRQLSDAGAMLPEVKSHMENLLARLRHPRISNPPALHKADAVISPRETSEVQPFLVVSPSDIVTLVNSLFPERRPPSIHTDKESGRKAIASAASSMSGVSIPFRPSSTPGDGSSVLSMSASSMTSDTTSREPLLDRSDKSDNSDDSADEMPLDRPHFGPIRVVPTEEYGRRLRMACSEMSRILGSEAIAGSCHPCAERWAVLFISNEGKGLRTRMQEDFEDEDENDEDSPDNDSEDEASGLGMDLENDYHQLKESISRLLQEYEVPKSLAPESESKAFSNRNAAQKLPRRALRRTDPTNRLEDLTTTQSQISALRASQGSSPVPRNRLTHPRSNSTSEAEELKRQRTSALVVILEAARHQCQTREQYVNALKWHKTLEQLYKLSPSLSKNGFAPLLNYFARGPRDSVNRSLKAIDKFEAWFAWLKQSQERYETNVEKMMLSFKTLRDKMWFKTAVLTSAGYEEAKNLAIALKLMGQPIKPQEDKTTHTHKPRQFSRSSTNNFLLKTENQLVEMIATVPDRAGPNKLVDEQAEMTSKWLTNYGVENFCKGEERIHRFCLEVDKCVNKLVGDSVLDAPVLWSSELYRRDKDILDSGRQKGDLWLTGVGTLSISGDEEYETQSNRPVARSLDFVQPTSQSSLRSISTRGSQQSFDSSKWSSGSRGINLMDAQDYFGSASPALAIDPAITFWSPFQTAGQTSASSNNIRPMSSASPRGAVMLKHSAAVNDDKRKFLLDLKQTLTGLLLSDLGTLVFNNGSETDGWFSGEIGEECIQRKEAEERRRKQKLARKKSMRSLKSAASREQRANKLESLSRTERGSTPPIAAVQHADAGEHSGSSSEATALSAGRVANKKAGLLLEFPYNTAYRRLLDKFATHPSPFAKLHFLYELEQLIVAALDSKMGRKEREPLPEIPQSPTLGSVPELSSRQTAVPTSQAKNLDEAIANVENRRSYTMLAQEQSTGRESPSLYQTGAKSPKGPPSTDMIVDVLQSLFRDADIRPKTLFRDLQYIAAFVPASMLDKTARGKAFWDAGLAALGLKQDVCRYMVEIADDIVAENTQNRTAGHGGTTPTPESQSVSRWSMSDAANMYIITAKEGDAAAERELAIFYLTHPDLLPRTLLPLSKPREIFKESLLNQKREDPERSDPMTMCVAHHWMELSKKGGDELATKYLRARDDFEKIP